MNLKKVDCIPERGELRKNGKWPEMIEQFIASNADFAVVEEESASDPAKNSRRVYNGLMMAIRRKYADVDVRAVWRHGQIYLAKKSKMLK